jgi:hypothetical protein
MKKLIGILKIVIPKAMVMVMVIINGKPSFFLW